MQWESAKNSPSSEQLTRAEWLAERSEHIAAVGPWVHERVERANRGEPHPIYDFLFTYYSFRPAHLMRWSPGPDVVVLGVGREELDWSEDYAATSHGFQIPASAFPSHRHNFLRWGLTYLRRIQERPASLCCFGLHEWAMLYRCDSPRHTHVPLRLDPRVIDSVVENSDLRCTHYDAFRFFTSPAVPLNRVTLSRAQTPDFDQRGCIHVTMDLYKFAYQLAPWCPSSLLAKAFLLAVDARVIDMRASPYDTRQFGFEPIPIELPSGREEYIEHQRHLAERGSSVRAELITVYEHLLGGSVSAASLASIANGQNKLINQPLTNTLGKDP